MPSSATCPVKDCTLPVDIVLRSSDKCLIGAHKENLAHFSEAFPTPDSVTSSDTPVDLSENGEALRSLMQFMHHHRLPTLDKSFNFLDGPSSLFALAEAAEKYLVYSAMALCNVRIAEQVSWFPLECLAYALKYDYPDIADAAARGSLGTDVEKVISLVGAANRDGVLAWVRYREKYIMVAEEIIQYPMRDRDLLFKRNRCEDPTGHWNRFTKAVLAELPQSPLDLVKELTRCLPHFPFSLSEYVEKHVHILDGCPRGVCRANAKAWVDRCATQLSGIGEFHTFLNAA
ncbi:hypothetical protein NMY22_g8240 [Coprinellus aureogranulatus]|nr:hypothetical protein NMY22_g8240 [Coprinellus aureogranulatus]